MKNAKWFVSSNILSVVFVETKKRREMREEKRAEENEE